MPARRRAAKKMARADKPYDAPIALGAGGDVEVAAALDESAKDDEERELEALLFGRKRVSKQTKHIAETPTVQYDSHLFDSGMGHVADADLFMMDTPPSTSNPLDAGFSDDDEDLEQVESDEEEGRGAGRQIFSGSHDGSNDDEDASEVEVDDGEDSELDSDHSDASSSSSSSSLGRRNQSAVSTAGGLARRQAWHDPDDANVAVSLASDNRLRKLRHAIDEDTVTGKEFETRLRTQFESFNPRPKWASLSSDSPASGSSPLSSLLSSSSPFIASSRGKLGSTQLPAGQLDIERIRDVKGGEEGAVRALGWAPGANRSILAVAGNDRRVRIYNIDGPSNPLLSAIHLPSLPISSLQFHPTSPSTLLLSGPRPYLHLVSLQTSTSTRVPLLPLTSAQPSSLSSVAFSPQGNILAAASSSGVHLLSFGSGGPQGLLGTLKASGGGGRVESVRFAKDGRELWMLGGRSGEVSVWDIGQRRCISKWKDEDGAGFGARLMDRNESAGLTAVGSSTGIVNLYSSATGGLDLTSSTFSSASGPSTTAPTLLKSFDNITVPLTSLAFNPDGQLLAAASSERKDTLRIYHTPSRTAYQNWPTAGTPLGVVTALGWSPRSDVLAMGNQRGRVLLYRLRGYSAY